MGRKNGECNNKRFLLWLGGLTLQDRLMTCDRGRVVSCIYCGRSFFDLEPEFDRNMKRCREPHLKHDCVGVSNYTILYRSFAGIEWVAVYEDGVSEEQAVVDYFKKGRK